MLLLTLLASLYGLMILVRKWLSLPYAQAPFVAIISLMSVLYVAGLFGLLWYVSWFVFLAGLVCFALSLYKITLGIPSRTVFRRLISDHSLFPLTAFGVLFLFSWFVFRNSYITSGDKFSHWALFTKSLPVAKSEGRMFVTRQGMEKDGLFYRFFECFPCFYFKVGNQGFEHWIAVLLFGANVVKVLPNDNGECRP